MYVYAGLEVLAIAPATKFYILPFPTPFQIIEAQPKKFRGPYLARLELNRRMVEQRYAAEQLFGKMSDMLAEYFELFADKPCCALDMKLFLEFVKPAHERRTLAGTVPYSRHRKGASLYLDYTNESRLRSSFAKCRARVVHFL